MPSGFSRRIQRKRSWIPDILLRWNTLRAGPSKVSTRSSWQAQLERDSKSLILNHWKLKGQNWASGNQEAFNLKTGHHFKSPIWKQALGLSRREPCRISCNSGGDRGWISWLKNLVLPKHALLFCLPIKKQRTTLLNIVSQVFWNLMILERAEICDYKV